MHSEAARNIRQALVAPSALVSGRSAVLLVAAITTAVAALMVFRLAHPAPWTDEIFTLIYIRNDFGFLFDLGREAERHPPAHFVSLKAWAELFGESVLSARLLSVVFALACLPLVYAILRPRLGIGTALLTILLLGIFPGFVHFGREARMYAELFFFLILATYCFGRLMRVLEAQDSGAAIRWTLGFALSLTLTFYTHYTAAIYFACFAVTVLALALTGLRRIMLWGLGGIALATLLAVPQITHMISFVAPEADEWIEPTTLRRVYTQMMGAYPFPWWAKPVMFALYLRGAWLFWARDQRLALLALSFLVLGPALLALIGTFRPALLVRTLQPFTLLSPALLALALLNMPGGDALRRAGAWAGLAFVVAAHFLALRPDYPAERQALFIESAAEQLAVIDPATDRIFFIAHLEEQFALARYGREAALTPITFAAPEAERRAIASRLASCDGPGAATCGRTLLIMEQAPLFERKAGAGWRTYFDKLAERHTLRAKWIEEGFIIYEF